MAKFNIVLYKPVIAGNTGSIGRTCVGLNLRLILIGPLGFDISEKRVRRAGLDYWKFVDLSYYDSFQDFFDKEAPKREKLFFFSRFASSLYYEAKFSEKSYLIFGAEVKGLPEEIHKDYEDRLYKLPSYSDKIRSFNLANVATAVSFEALRQIDFS